MPENFTYEIGGKRYTQRPLVLGQSGKLNEFRDDRSGHNFAACILRDEHGNIPWIVIEDHRVVASDKLFADFSLLMAQHLTPDMFERLQRDFLACNPSLSQATGRTEEKATSSISSASCQEETLPEETLSSGDTPQRNVNRT